MKTKIILSATAISLFLLFTFLSCNKGGDELLYHSNIHLINLSGYNNSNEELILQLDTFSPTVTPAFSKIAFGATYNFNDPGKQHLKFTMKSKATDKILLEREIRANETTVETNLNVIYMNGKVGDFPAIPELVEGKVQLIYMFQSNILNYREPVDIVFKKYYFLPKVFEEVIRIKNLKPNEFSQPISFTPFPLGVQDYNGQKTPVLFRAHIYKAGTDIPYTAGTSYEFNPLTSVAPVPSPTKAASKLFIINEAPVNNIIQFNKVLEL
ncbi:hypothetical protein [Sphingobacterium athyrii]|nr:hypothetical protein [Sphingobacterium athyrii]